MNFRQRVAWLLVAVFLVGTCGMAYYIFEISDQFSVYALQHVETYHSGRSIVSGEGGGRERSSRKDPTGGVGWALSVGHHLVDIPLALWLLLLVLPYLQVFCLLLACTKAEPRYSPAYLWPLFLYLKCRTLYHRWAHPLKKSFNSPVANGHGQALLIDT